jgi:hypothetical protein
LAAAIHDAPDANGTLISETAMTFSFANSRQRIAAALGGCAADGTFEAGCRLNNANMIWRY